MSKTLILSLALFLVGCASPALLSDSRESPASSQAPESKQTGASSVLFRDKMTVAILTRLKETRASGSSATISHHKADDAQLHTDHSNVAHGQARELQAGKAPAPVSYTCPMHPEIEQPNPGSCSSCGMTLIEKGSK